MMFQQCTARDLVFWGEMVNLAYEMKSASSTYAPQAHAELPAGWKILFDLVAEPDLVFFYEPEFIGYLAVNELQPHLYALVFCSTDNMWDAVYDMDFPLTPFTELPNGGEVSEAFLNVYRNLKVVLPGEEKLQDWEMLMQYLTPGAQVVLAGHCLGGALATLQAALMADPEKENPQIRLFTYGSPMVGDNRFVKTFHRMVSESYRVYNLPDWVPQFPGTFLDYAHVHTGIQVNSGLYPQIRRSLYCFHALPAYLYALGSRRFGLGVCGE